MCVASELGICFSFPSILPFPFSLLMRRGGTFFLAFCSYCSFDSYSTSTNRQNKAPVKEDITKATKEKVTVHPATHSHHAYYNKMHEQPRFIKEKTPIGKNKTLKSQICKQVYVLNTRSISSFPQTFAPTIPPFPGPWSFNPQHPPTCGRCHLCRRSHRGCS